MTESESERYRRSRGEIDHALNSLAGATIESVRIVLVNEPSEGIVGGEEPRLFEVLELQTSAGVFRFSTVSYAADASALELLSQVEDPADLKAALEVLEED